MARTTPENVDVTVYLNVTVGRPRYPMSADRLIAIDRDVTDEQIVDLANRIEALCREYERELIEAD